MRNALEKIVIDRSIDSVALRRVASRRETAKSDCGR